jgi:hypothetical protein
MCAHFSSILTAGLEFRPPPHAPARPSLQRHDITAPDPQYLDVPTRQIYHAGRLDT